MKTTQPGKQASAKSRIMNCDKRVSKRCKGAPYPYGLAEGIPRKGNLVKDQTSYEKVQFTHRWQRFIAGSWDKPWKYFGKTAEKSSSKSFEEFLILIHPFILE